MCNADKGCLCAAPLLAVALPQDAASQVLTELWYAGTRMLQQLLQSLRCRPRCSVLSRFWRPSRGGEHPVLFTTLQDPAATGCSNCLLSCRLCCWSVILHAVYSPHARLACSLLTCHVATSCFHICLLCSSSRSVCLQIAFECHFGVIFQLFYVQFSILSTLTGMLLTVCEREADAFARAVVSARLMP